MRKIAVVMEQRLGRQDFIKQLCKCRKTEYFNCFEGCTEEYGNIVAHDLVNKKVDVIVIENVEHCMQLYKVLFSTQLMTENLLVLAIFNQKVEWIDHFGNDIEIYEFKYSLEDDPNFRVFFNKLCKWHDRLQLSQEKARDIAYERELIVKLEKIRDAANDAYFGISFRYISAKTISSLEDLGYTVTKKNDDSSNPFSVSW